MSQNIVFAQKTTALAPQTPAGNLAAPTVRDTAIAKLFKHPADLKWVKNFKGRMDDASVVDLALGFDGKNCRGYLTYAKSKVRFQLDGTLDSLRGFRLEESDAARTLTGRLQGSYKNHRLEAEWTNMANTLGSRLEADEMMPGQTVSVGCSDNKWNNRYITRYKDARADLVLSRVQNGQLYGYLWVEADAKTYSLKGDLDEMGNYELEALLSNGKAAGLLQGNLKNPQSTDCNWVGSGEKRTFKFTLKANFPLGCYEYADYRSSYDVLYPRTPCTGCNTWLDQQVTAWVNRCKATLANKKDALTAATRSLHRASTWSEISCWTENVFTGYLTFSDTWSDQAQGIAYNFDLRTGKEITFNELFNKGFNAKGWLADYAKKEMPKIPSFAADPPYREWLDKEGFPLFALRREGLELSTLFHPIYGRQILLVPYGMLKPYMKKENPIAEFVK